MPESRKTSESQNPAQDVQGAFDTTVNFRVFAFVSLGMQEKLTPENLNAYARVFDKTGSAEVKEIDQQGLEGLKKKFTEEKAQFGLDRKTEQQKINAAKFSSKVKAGVDNFKKGANLVSQGVDETAKKLVGFVEGKKKENREAAAAKMAAKEQEAKAAAEANAARDAEATAQSKAAAEAQAARDA